MTMAVSSYRYQTRRTDEPLRTQLVELAREKPRFGYRRLHVLLGRSGEHVNHKHNFDFRTPGTCFYIQDSGLWTRIAFHRITSHYHDGDCNDQDSSIVSRQPGLLVHGQRRTPPWSWNAVS